MPTKEEILTLLDKLDDHVADDLESEEIEFKPWNSDMKVNRRFAQEYAVCFANSNGGFSSSELKTRSGDAKKQSEAVKDMISMPFVHRSIKAQCRTLESILRS